MGFLDSIKKAAGDLTTKAKQFKNDAFKEAVISICARVAAADGTIEPAEKKAVAKAIQSFEALKVFDARELGSLFNTYCDDATDDFGIINLNNRIGKLAKNREAALTAIQIGIAIANSDGNFSADEKKVVKELLGLLKLSEADLGIAL
ncbi:MAG: TerB family tellurite resistance protein [Candidatus Obscuribacter sp.]|nr:tellurite resistance TerB family protein [Candidatus Melainabacteria bacterium]MDX1985692.1 TerB family tellurite resistance protein [Candidatus Obscuribacter sp.]